MTSNKTKKQKSKVNEAFEPVVVQGSHLTVTTWPDGHTELKWDDDALLRDVQAAILKYESVIPVVAKKPKRTTKKVRQ